MSKTPSGNSLASRDIASLVHPYTHLRRHLTDGPLVIVRGDGVRVYDEDGKEYIEGMAGLWCASLGFSEPRLADAASRQMRRLPFYHVFAGKSHEPGIELAERLLAMAPVPMARVFFANSGSEANDTAIKLIWYYSNARGLPHKKKIIARQRGYHGVTVATASLTGLPGNQRDFDLPIANIVHADAAHYYTGAQAGESEAAYVDRLIAALEQLIAREGADTIAAFFAEPVMGAGGVLIPPAGYFERVQEVLRRHDILFVVDEVICGFCRTGAMFGCETFGLKPDMITLAKALSSGYLPISALMIGDKVWQAMLNESDKIGSFGHGYTYSAHPVAAAVAIETLDIYRERDMLGHVRAVSPAFLAGLRRAGAHPMIGEVQGVGLLAGVKFVADKPSRKLYEASLGVGAQFGRFAQAHGLVVRPLLGDRVALCPPLIITENEIAELWRRFDLALADLTAWAAAAGHAPSR